MSEEIVIEVTPAGTVTIDANGFTGSSCAKATEQIELVLGGGQVKKDKKPEFFAPPVNNNQANKMTF